MLLREILYGGEEFFFFSCLLQLFVSFCGMNSSLLVYAIRKSNEDNPINVGNTISGDLLIISLSLFLAFMETLQPF